MSKDDYMQQLLDRAGRTAKLAIEQDDLQPRGRIEGEYYYDPQQGAKAACLAREDAVAIFTLEVESINLLRSINEKLLWLLILVVAAAAKLFFF